MKKPKVLRDEATRIGGRPRKAPPAFHGGEDAAKRFKEGLLHMLDGGPQPPETSR